MRTEDVSMFASTMFVFKLFQNGIIFTALVSGFICLTHIIYSRVAYCRNALAISTIVLVGFSHMIICVHRLEATQESIEREDIVVEDKGCLDYFVPALISNAAILTVILHNVIKNNIKSTIAAVIAWVISLGSIICALFIIIRNYNDGFDHVYQQSIITFGSKNATHLDVFWSVCQKTLSHEKGRLLIEYCLVYFPVAVVIMLACCADRKKSKGSLLKLQVLSNESCGDYPESCDCIKLNNGLIAMLVYSVIILLVARPLVLLYARATSGLFRDVLPSLLQTAMFCFICSEYISKVIFKRFQSKQFTEEKGQVMSV